MSDYTPTTENIRSCYVYATEGYDGGLAIPEQQSKAEFDRWLAAHDAEVASKAWDEGVSVALNHAIRNEDGVTLRLEHLDGRPWGNPHQTGTEEARR